VLVNEDLKYFMFQPFFFPLDGGQKLNVEEKKTRVRPSMDGRMSSGGDNMFGRPPSGMGGSRGGAAGMRGGPGMGPHRGGGRGSFSREGRGGGMSRPAYRR
jgi:ATP-dependent RNA helicase DeaD